MIQPSGDDDDDDAYIDALLVVCSSWSNTFAHTRAGTGRNHYYNISGC